VFSLVDVFERADEFNSQGGFDVTRAQDFIAKVTAAPGKINFGLDRQQAPERTGPSPSSCTAPASTW